MSTAPKRFPRDLQLLNGTTVPVATVHYSLGGGYWRVSYAGHDRPLGCIAAWEADTFVERTVDELRAESKLILAGVRE